MSILLDAVIRDKQQKNVGVIDPILTPSPVIIKPQARVPLSQVGIVFIAMATGLIAAWFTVAYQQGPDEKFVAKVNPVSAVNVQSKMQPKSIMVQNELRGNTRTSQTLVSNTLPLGAPTSEYRIAAKVSLPKARIGTVPSPTAESAAHADIAQTNLGQSLASHQNLSATQRDEQLNLDKATSEPIILGANANERGKQQLAALRQQVNITAAELGAGNGVGNDIQRAAYTETSKEKEIHQTPDMNNLVAAFEAALKDVELTESINQDVTRPELDPIPQRDTSNTIPKYGQLPLPLQSQVPEFNINAHVYAGSPEKRWLNVDGAELQQGDFIQGKLKIIEIRPRDIVLEINGTEFRVPAI